MPIRSERASTRLRRPQSIRRASAMMRTGLLRNAARAYVASSARAARNANVGSRIAAAASTRALHATHPAAAKGVDPSELSGIIEERVLSYQVRSFVVTLCSSGLFRLCTRRYEV